MSTSTPRPEGTSTPVTLDDPHLQPMAKNPKRMEALAALSMLIGMAGFAAFIFVYWINAANQWEALTLGIGMLGLGVGVIAWGKYLMPQGPFVEERHDFQSTDDERTEFNAAITGRGGLEVKRRKMLLGIFALGGGLMTLALIIPGIRSLGPKPANGPQPFRLDTFGIDSAYDYDPFWAKCVELGIAPVSHSSHMHLRVSRSPSNYVYNHIGCLGTSHESLAKSLFMGGVTRRFPELRVGFLEGGVAWACALYADLLGHWSKRNSESILELDPDRLDVEKLMGYVKDFGDDQMIGQLDRLKDFFSQPAARPKQLDEFSRALIKRAEDIRDLFVPSFGCEADDPLVKWAFADDVNPMGAKLRAMIGSDISHWDVPDMTEPVEEAWEMVEHGKLTEDNFKDFTFTNPLRLHAGANPKFFEGTICEAAAAKAIAGGLG